MREDFWGLDEPLVVYWVLLIKLIVALILGPSSPQEMTQFGQFKLAS